MICLAVCATLCAVAQGNRICVGDVEVARGATVTVPVVLANQDTTRGVQFKVMLPQGLRCEEWNLAPRTQRLGFILNNVLKNGAHSVMIYQVGRGAIPPGDEAIAIMTLKADDTFNGGEITVMKCRGSTMDNKSMEMDGSTSTVTVPTGNFFFDSAPLPD